MASDAAKRVLSGDEPLRLAYLTYRGKPHVGGQGVYTRHLTKALVDLGHHVEVYGGQPYPVLDQRIALHQLRSLDLFNDLYPGRFPAYWEFKSLADLVEVSAHEVADAVKGASERGVLVRGLGRSYGDAAQNSGGLVLRLAGSADHAVLDAETGTVTVPAGVSIDELLRVLVPQGWFVPVTPGTRFVTIGGAIASDIHGKNHHVEGSFGDHVTTLTLLLADGSVEAIGPDRRPELFWATVGGMGLTGVILEATFRLLPIESSRILVDTCRVPDLESLFAAMTEGDDRYRYSVAWIDLLARGRQLGRSVLTRGDHAPRAALTSRAS